FGAGTNASGTQSTALGQNAQATAQNAVALGRGSVADQANTVSVGTSTALRRIVNVAPGTAPSDVATVSQLGFTGVNSFNLPPPVATGIASSALAGGGRETRHFAVCRGPAALG